MYSNVKRQSTRQRHCVVGDWQEAESAVMGGGRGWWAPLVGADSGHKMLHIGPRLNRNSYLRTPPLYPHHAEYHHQGDQQQLWMKMQVSGLQPQRIHHLLVLLCVVDQTSSCPPSIINYHPSNVIFIISVVNSNMSISAGTIDVFLDHFLQFLCSLIYSLMRPPDFTE